MKTQAIVVVSFGTANRSAGEKSIEEVKKTIGQAFPEAAVFHAFTSRKVIRILTEQGLAADTPSQILKKLSGRGMEAVYVLPTFLAPGGEYRRLLAELEEWKQQFPILKIAKPLLAEETSRREAADILAQYYPHRPGEAMIFMGHGAKDSDNSCYHQLEEDLQNRLGRQTFAALLHGSPDVGAAIDRVQNSGCTAVRLVPLMLSAGNHVTRQMAGDASDSWKNRFLDAGLPVTCEEVGLGELPPIRQLYRKQLMACMEDKAGWA